MKPRLIVIYLILICILSGCGLFPTPTPAFIPGDPIYQVPQNDPEMAAAILQAQKTLPEFIDHLKNPLPKQNFASLKARFPYDDLGNYEDIWIGNLAYDGEVFTGTIGNDPAFVTNLKFGDKVTIKPQDVSDWMIVQDGKLVGGYTILVVRSRLKPEERPAFDQGFGIKIEDTQK
jgi:uncharacterized protein YegJ (DUF2314 family)